MGGDLHRRLTARDREPGPQRGNGCSTGLDVRCVDRLRCTLVERSGPLSANASRFGRAGKRLALGAPITHPIGCRTDVRQFTGRLGGSVAGDADGSGRRQRPRNCRHVDRGLFTHPRRQTANSFARVIAVLNVGNAHLTLRGTGGPEVLYRYVPGWRRTQTGSLPSNCHPPSPPGSCAPGRQLHRSHVPPSISTGANATSAPNGGSCTSISPALNRVAILPKTWALTEEIPGPLPDSSR